MSNSGRSSRFIKAHHSLAWARLVLLIGIFASMGVFPPGTAPDASARFENATRSGNSSQALGWSALPNGGLNNNVVALAVSGTDLYAGGDFTATLDGAVTNLNRIAKLSGGVWSALPHNGLNGTVTALAVVGSDLYVGGDFTATSDGAVTGLNNIAKLSGGVWSALPNGGLDKRVLAFAAKDGDLFVGGYFNATADSALNLIHVARLSGGQWFALPNGGLHYVAVGDPGFVDAFAVIGNDLYVGGNFKESADGSLTNLNYIARLEGLTSAWRALPNQGLDYIVGALAVSGSDLYVGGGNSTTFDGAVTGLRGISRFSGAAWSALPNGGLAGSASAMAIFGGDLYAGGNFATSGDFTVTDVVRVARLSGGAWSPLPNLGLNDNVTAFAVIGSELYVGGLFSRTADGSMALPFIAKLSNSKVFLPVLHKSYSGQ